MIHKVIPLKNRPPAGPVFMGIGGR